MATLDEATAMLPVWDIQAHGQKRHQTSKPYNHLLRKSPEIMRRWMEREQVRHG